MTSNIQFGNFTHAKCNSCGKFGSMGDFIVDKQTIGKSKGDDGSCCEMIQLIITCPICTSPFCEASSINELN